MTSQVQDIKEPLALLNVTKVDEDIKRIATTRTDMNQSPAVHSDAAR